MLFVPDDILYTPDRAMLSRSHASSSPSRWCICITMGCTVAEQFRCSLGGLARGRSAQHKYSSICGCTHPLHIHTYIPASSLRSLGGSILRCCFTGYPMRQDSSPTHNHTPQSNEKHSQSVIILHSLCLHLCCSRVLIHPPLPLSSTSLL